MLHPRHLPLLLLLTGCATAAGGDPMVTTGGTSTVLNTSRGRSVTVGTGDDFAAPTRLAAPADRAWQALLAALPALEIPVETVNPATRTAGTQRALASGRFAGRPISSYLVCGGTAGVAEVADLHNITLAVVARVTPVDGESRLAVQVAGSAKDPFTSTPARSCTTTGALEARVDSTMRVLLGLPTGDERVAAGPQRPAGLAELAPPADEVDVGELGPAAEQLALPPSHPLLLTLGAVAGGAVGSLAGSQIGADCEQRCINARGTLGPLIGNAVLIPLGTHLANRGRGSMVNGLLASAGWAAAAAVAGGLTGEVWTVWAAVPGQVLTSVLIERAGTGRE